MIRKLLLVAGILLSTTFAASAQNIQCPDRPASDSSNACANTRFVQNHSSLPPISGGNAGQLLGNDGTNAVWQSFLQSGSGAVSRTWNSKVADIVNAKDFGVTCDGTTTDTVAIQAAETYRASIGGELVFPPGTCKTAGITINRANGGGWRGTGQTRLIPTANSITFMSVTGAVVSGTAPRPFYVENMHFDGNAQTGITAYSENSPYLTSLKHLKVTNVQFAALIVGSVGSSQTGWVNIDDIEQIGSGSWAFLGGDDSHYIFAINISNFVQNGTGASTWTGATQAFLLRRAVSVMFDNVLLKSLDGVAAGFYMTGDCQGIFINNTVVVWPTYGIRSEVGTDTLKPAYVYINNFGVDQHTVSGADVTGRTWFVNNSNFANGYVRTNSGSGFLVRATATDFSISNTLFAYDYRSGLVVQTGATKIRVNSITAENNNQVAGSFYQVDLQASLYTDVALYGRNYITGTTNATGQALISGISYPLNTTSFKPVLTAARTFYVRSDGNDSNTCETNSAGGACLTINGAISRVNGYNIAGQVATIQVVDTGSPTTYTTPVVLRNVDGATAPGQLVIQGNNSTPANVVISTTSADGFSATGITSVWDIKDLKIQTTTIGNGITSSFGSYVRISNIDFGVIAGNQISASTSGTVEMIGNCSVSGSAATFAYAEYAGSSVRMASRTITFTASVTYSVAFVRTRVTGTIASFSNTFTLGAFTVTGLRYSSAEGGYIFTNQTSDTYFPGTTIGTTNNNSGTIDSTPNFYYLRVASNFTKTSDAALGNIPGLSANVAAGVTYGFKVRLYTTSNAASGIQAAIAGTATATAIVYDSHVTQTGLILTIGTSRGTALATKVADVTAATAGFVEIFGTITVNAAGTLTAQFAQNVSGGTGSVVLAGSTMEVWRIQ